MAYTQEQIDALKSKMAEGVLTVTDGNGTSVTFRSLSEMERMLRKMENEIADSARPKRTVAVYDDGL